MWSNIQWYFQKKQLRDLLDTHKSIKRLQNWNELKTCAILSSCKSLEELYQVKKLCLQISKQHGITPTLFMLTSAKLAKENEEAFQATQVVTDKDFDWLGRLGSPVTEAHEKQTFDLCITLESSNSLNYQLVFASISAKLLIGKDSTENQASCDFMIQLNKNQSQKDFLNQAFFYLKYINQPQKRA